MIYAMGQIVFRSIQLIQKFSKKYLPLSMLYKLFQGIVPMISIACMQQIINAVQNSDVTFDIILRLIVFYVILQIINNIFGSLYGKYNYKFNLEFSNYISLQLLNKAMHLSLKDYENKDTYNLINRAQGQSGTNIINFMNLLFDILQQIVSVVSLSYILLNYKWEIAIIIAIVPVLRSVVTYFFDKKLYTMRMERTLKERQKWYINFLMTTGNSFKEIKVLGIGEYLIKKYEYFQKEIIQDEKGIYNKSTWANIWMDTLEWIISGSIYTYIFYQGVVRVILIGDVSAYLECINKIKSSISEIFLGINNLVEQSMYIKLIFEYMDLPETLWMKEKEVEYIKQIEFRNVSFKYKNGKYAVKNVSFTIERGTRIALVGENGSGKSTLLKILLGLYDEYEGNIYINCVNLREINTEKYHRKIGVMFQDYVKYEASIRENIAYGNIAYLRNDAEINKLVRAVHLENKANNAKGVDTVLGNWFGEQQFSGGEWQRIALARALARKADIYLFDEPDASLDVFRQREMIELIKNATKDKIGIYVSHKIDFVNEVVDKIIVLEDGMIVEYGSHEELLANRKKYYQLYSEAKSK